MPNEVRAMYERPRPNGFGDSGQRHREVVTVMPGPVPHRPPIRPSQPGGVNFALLLQALRRNMLLILACAIVGALVGFAVQGRIQPRYSSAVELLLDPKRADSFGAEGQFTNVYVDSTKIASVVSIIESSELLSRVVAKENLGADPEFGDPAQSRLRKWLGFLPFIKQPEQANDPEARAQRALNRLERGVRVERLGMTYALLVGVTTSSPDSARRLATAVVDAYLNDLVDTKSTATQRDSTWLVDRLGELRRKLAESEEAVDTIRQQYGLQEIGKGPGETIDRQSLTDLNTQLTQAQADVVVRRAHYEQAERLRASGGNLETLSAVATAPVIAELRRKQIEIDQQLTALRAVYDENYPDVRRAKDDKRALQAQMAAEVSRVVAGIRNDYDNAVARESALRDRLRQITSAHGGADSAEGRVRLRDAERLVDANRGLYEALLARWREVQQQMAHVEPEARVISEAGLPDAPSWPKPLLLPLGGAVGFMLIGVAFTLIPALMDRRLVSVVDVEQRLGLPVLGMIPILKRRELRQARRKLSILDYARRKPLSRFAESLRLLRAYLRISAAGAPRVIQVTSAIPGEGKSTVAATLAVSAALAGIKTVLVDVDLRFSAVSSMFEVQRDAGLVDILCDDVPLEAVLRPQKQMPLAIIGAGSKTHPQPDLLGSERFRALMRELSETYNLVILDCPPVLAVSDALVVAGYADATLLVVQWRATVRDLVEQAVKTLRDINAPLVGVMLNKIDPSRTDQYEYGYLSPSHASGKYYRM